MPGRSRALRIPIPPRGTPRGHSHDGEAEQVPSRLGENTLGEAELGEEEDEVLRELEGLDAEETACRVPQVDVVRHEAPVVVEAESVEESVGLKAVAHQLKLGERVAHHGERDQREKLKHVVQIGDVLDEPDGPYLDDLEGLDAKEEQESEQAKAKRLVDVDGGDVDIEGAEDGAGGGELEEDVRVGGDLEAVAVDLPPTSSTRVNALRRGKQ